MANCRACGGNGLDCFNEQDCLEISNRQYQDEQIIHQLEEYVRFYSID
jgi:hypothetical protein